MSYYDDVKAFHNKFAIPLPEKPQIQPQTIANYRLIFLEEELAEIYTALATNDLVGLADGLADLVYVALGTAALYGIPFDDVWKLVHAANMTKQRGPVAQTKRGHEYDLVKPKGFVAPDVEIAKLIKELQK